MVQCHVGAFDISKPANLPNKRQLAKKTLVEQNSQKKDLFDIMNNNYGKGNMVDGILKLLLSNENLASLDKTLVTLFTEMSEFDMLVEGDTDDEKAKSLVRAMREAGLAERL